MKLLKIAFLACCLAACGPIVINPGLGRRANAQNRRQSDADKTMAKLSQLVGGTWVNTDPKFVVENHYEWAFGKR